MSTKFISRNIDDKIDGSELQNFVKTSDIDELCNMMTDRISQADAPKLLDNILQGFSNTENCQTKRRKLVESVLKRLKTATVTTNHVDAIVNRIAIEFPHYAKQSLLKLVEFCLASIRNNDDDSTSWKDVLPLLLETLKEEKYINYKGSEVSGAEYKSLIVKSICSTEWDPKISTSLAKMFREISLEKNDLEIVMRALCDKLPASDRHEIPPLVHQLLWLGDDSRLILNSLYRYFSHIYREAAEHENPEKIEKINLKEVQEVESTVLYHIYHAIQMNHKILKDFTRCLKSIINTPEFVLDPFIISVLLLNSTVNEDQVFEILRLAVARKIQEEERGKNSAWLRNLLSNELKVMDVVGEVIQNSNKDRKVIIQNLVTFAFILLGVEKRLNHDELALWELGAKIIQKVARKVHESGATILQLLSDRIISGGSSVSQYTDCLAWLCHKRIIIILDNQTWVVTLLEELLTIPGGAAIQVLYAILPLIKLSHSIRDTLVLVLRKALTQKDTYTRQMAILGFLQLLKNLKVSSLNALSQGNSSSSTSTSASSVFTQATLEMEVRRVPHDPQYNMSLCQELLSILRRCFIYDCNVKVYLYEGLYDAILVNAELTEYVSEMLLDHFKLFYEPDENTVLPIIFDKCSMTQGAEEVLQEPLGEFIFLIQKIYIKSALKNYAAVDQFAMILESLCIRMSQTEAEHLNLNELTDLTDTVPKSQKTLINLKLTISIYEALIAYRFGAWSMDSYNVAQSVNSLFKGYLRFTDFLKRSNKTKKGDVKNKTDKDVTDKSMIRKYSRAVTLKPYNTVMDFNTIYKMLSLLFESKLSWTTKEQADVLRKCTEFHHYVLQTCLQLLRNAKLLKGNDFTRYADKNSKTFFQIGRLLYQKVITELDMIRIFDQITAVFALECFKELCDLMCNFLPSELPKFLNTIGEIDVKEGLNSQIQGLLTPLKVALHLALEEEMDDEAIIKKIPLYLMETISYLVHKVPFECNVKGDSIQLWLKQVAAMKGVESSVSLLIIQIMMFVEDRTNEIGDILNDICVEICGKSSEDTPPTTEEFEIINERTMTQIHSAVNQTVKSKLNNAAWLLSRLKAEQNVVSIPGMEDEARREELKSKERKLCYYLAYINTLLVQLVQTKVEPGPNTDAVFKNLQLMFNILSNLTKHFISKSNSQNIAFESTKFNQLVECAGRTLKPCIDEYISEIEEHQNKKQNKSSDSNARRNKFLRETKVIPRVIYEIEQFNKDILTLSKKTGIELNKHIKHSVTRDFRLDKVQMVERLERMDVSMLTTQNTTHNATRAEDHDRSAMSERISGESESENENTPSKRRRLNSCRES